MLIKVLRASLKYLYSIAYDKHPSRKVMNFRHLLSCDTVTSYFEDELQRSYSNRKEQVKSYFANIVFKFEQLWMAEQEIQ